MSSYTVFFVLNSSWLFSFFYYFLFKNNENHLHLHLLIHFLWCIVLCARDFWGKNINHYQHPACISRHGKAQADLPHGSWGAWMCSVCLCNSHFAPTYIRWRCTHKTESGAHLLCCRVPATLLKAGPGCTLCEISINNIIAMQMSTRK